MITRTFLQLDSGCGSQMRKCTERRDFSTQKGNLMVKVYKIFPVRLEKQFILPVTPLNHLFKLTLGLQLGCNCEGDWLR